MKEYLNKWMGRHNIVKMSTIPKMIDRFNIIPIKIPAGFTVAEIDK